MEVIIKHLVKIDGIYDHIFQNLYVKCLHEINDMINDYRHQLIASGIDPLSRSVYINGYAENY